MGQAAFSFENYKFTKACFDFSNVHPSDVVNIGFNLKGKYLQEQGSYILSMGVKISMKQGEQEKKDREIMEIDCEALFKFKEISSFEEVPLFFFPNSIAIIFPYVRAFISTLSLQANIYPLVLPTMNLMSLQEELKNNTTVVAKDENL